VSKIVKATPESQYSFSMQRKWFQRTTNIRKKTLKDFKMWQKGDKKAK